MKSATVLLSAAGALLCSLDAALNVAFPAIARWFGISPLGITALVVLYHIPLASLTIGGGVLGDRLGHRRVFTLGVWLSLLSFPLCALAPTFGVLLGARILQGTGAGLVFGTAPALITLTVPAGAAAPGLGFLNMAAGVGLAVGPLVAGVLVDLYGWPAAFLFRIPLALALALWCLPWLGSRGERDPFRALAWTLPPVPATVVLCDLLAFLANAALFGIYILGPFYLVQVLGYSATLAGFVFMLLPLSTALAGPVSGALARRVRASGLIAAGLAVQVAGLFLLGSLEAGSSLPAAAAAFAAAGFGIGAFQVPNMALVMGALPEQHQGFAGGMISAMRTLGIISGAALAPWLFETRRAAYAGAAATTSDPAAFMGAFGETLTASAALAALAFVLSLALSRRRHRPS